MQPRAAFAGFVRSNGSESGVSDHRALCKGLFEQMSTASPAGAQEEIRSARNEQPGRPHDNERAALLGLVRLLSGQK